MPVMLSYKVLGLIGLSSYALGLVTSRMAHVDHYRARIVMLDRKRLPAMPRGYSWRALSSADVANRHWHLGPCVPADWERQGLTCLSVHDAQGAAAGVIWVGMRGGVDRQLNLAVQPPADCAFDTGLWVPDERRMTRAFAAVAAALGEWMDQSGATRSISTITDHNVASIAAHERLGAATLGTVRVVRVGWWQWTIGARPALCRHRVTIPTLTLPEIPTRT